MPNLEISRLLVFVPARAPALQKAELHCRAGAPAGLESQRFGRPLCPIPELCKRLTRKDRINLRVQVFKRLHEIFERWLLIDVVDIDIAYDSLFINHEQRPFAEPV